MFLLCLSIINRLKIYDELISTDANDVSVQNGEGELMTKSSTSFKTAEASGDKMSQVGTANSKQRAFKLVTSL